jgi:1-acyl-sn-glycerol-3-phosphate acyltransferase
MVDYNPAVTTRYELPPAVPRTRSRLLRAFGRFAFRAIGWRFEGVVPDRPKMVAIVAPHTSNLDFFVGLFAKWALALDVSFLAKHTLFRGPLGWFFRAVGGIPVDRTASQNIVEQMVDVFARREELLLVVAPEGTRKRSSGWKTGFYHIARGAGVPILCIAFDYGPKVIRFGPAIEPSGDLERDLETIRAAYSQVSGKHPELMTHP